MLNAAKLVASFTLSSPAVADYIDILVDLLLVRRLRPFHSNVHTRLAKAQKKLHRGWRPRSSLTGNRWPRNADRPSRSRRKLETVRNRKPYGRGTIRNGGEHLLDDGGTEIDLILPCAKERTSSARRRGLPATLRADLPRSKLLLRGTGRRSEPVCHAGAELLSC